MYSENKKLLCDEGIQTRTEFRKWARGNHPDKHGNRGTVTRKFQEVSNAVDKLLPEKDSKIDCPEKKTPSNARPTPSNARPHPQQPVRKNLKKADCIRTTENWSKIQRYHRFDKPVFDRTKFISDMDTASPKMVKLLDNIRALDAMDMRKEGRMFKHFIFSDVKKGGYGAKIIASALVANGFHHCFTKSLKVVKPPAHPSDETFGVLSSTSIFDKTFTQKTVRQVLQMYNERPSNVYGENLRFIVLDAGFKEGIDLFDVKYVHIFENQRNNADLVQAIGRATRSCGQKGLEFVPNEGWKLHVYQYYLTHENPNDMVFNDYLRYSGTDLNSMIMGENLEKLAILSAVDYDLNYNINKFEEQAEESNDKNSNALVLANGGSSRLKGCYPSSKCGSRSTKSVPFTIRLLMKVYKKKLPSNFNKMLAKDKRAFFCKELINNPEYCARVNEMYNNPSYKESPLKNDTPPASNASSKKPSVMELALPSDNTDYYDIKDDLEGLEDLPFDEFMRKINRIYKEYKYDPIKIENHCESKPGANSDDRLVTFTNSQQFVTKYFTPDNFTKGMLVWHSVGTGKTCTAISVKSFLYDRMDYAVVWVTRNTLKEDIWKNMYDKICDHVIREKYSKDGGNRETLKKLMSKKFLPPMSYRQFSNMLEGKNELYNKLVSFNGKDDPLKKTLVIIDEAHKLYSKDLLATERPNMPVIENAFKNSNTCKVLLMTGTPVADDPMEFIKLMNLIVKKDPFPVSKERFMDEYMLNNEFTKSGKAKFQNKIKGLVSYLNRRFDPRQFTQPMFHKMPVTKSILSKESLMDCIHESEKKFDECKALLNEPSDANVIIVEKALKDAKERLDKLKEDVKKDKNNVGLKSELENMKALFKQQKKDLTKIKDEYKKQLQAYKNNLSACDKAMKEDVKACKKSFADKEHLFQNVTLEKC